MAIDLTNNTKRALGDLSLEPIIAVKIEGIDYIFSSGSPKEYIKIGDPGYVIGDDWYIGGFREVDGNKDLIDDSSTTYSIRQQMNYDEGEGNSISTMNIGLVDKDGLITDIISPSEDFDILGRKARIYIGFGTTSFNDDFIKIFQGYITEVSSNAGIVTFKINHPDNKKKISLFKNFTTKVTTIVQPTDLTIALEDTSGFIGAVDGYLSTYLVVNEEVVKYTVTGGTSASIVRAQLGTTAGTHEVGSEATSLYALTGNPLNIAMALMLSGNDDPYAEDVPVESFRWVVPGYTLPGFTLNGIFIKGIDLVKEYNVTVGDFVTTTGATNPDNNITDREIVKMEVLETGTALWVSSPPALGFENNTSAVMSFKSQFNVFDEGMGLVPDDVDIEQHMFVRDFFHPSTQYRLLIKEDIDNGKEFLDEQIYMPIACYSLPRKARASVGYSIGPIPGAEIKSLNINNIKDPKNLAITRSTGRAFFNEVIYKYDRSPITGNYLSGYGIISQTSKNRMSGSSRTYKVEANGIASDLNGANIVQSEASRIIDRYKFAAEILKASALLKDAVDLEIGDVTVFEGTGLSVSDINNGTRAFSPRLFEVRNKDINLKTGHVELELLDTAQDINIHYGLISPSSKIASVVSQSQIIITYMDGYPSKYGLDEYRNWENIMDLSAGVPVVIRDTGYTFEELAIVDRISENIFTFREPVVTTLAVGMIIELADYNDASVKEKLIYCYMTDEDNFDDGAEPYSMI